MKPIFLTEVPCHGPNTSFHQTLVKLEPGESTKKHRHPHTLETYFIASGTVEIYIENKHEILLSESFITIQPGVFH